MIAQRYLGVRGPAVSPIGLGCMDMSQFYGHFDDSQSIATIRRALTLGVTMFDTADMYGPFTNELLLARALKGTESGVLVATKFGNVKDADGKVIGVNGRPDYIRRACDGSLQRLGVDSIDLYYQHRVDRDTPIEETWGALSELVTEGKVRYLGICEASPDTIKRAHSVHAIAAVQTEYSLLSRGPERELLPLLRELGIGFVAYAPLGRGLLGGALKTRDSLENDDWRRGLPRFNSENIGRNLEVATQIRDFAATREATVAQLAIAWVLVQGDNIVAIPGTKRTERLEENLGALSIRLSKDDLTQLDVIAPPGVAAGDRYPDMTSVDI
jgi:aryl-alcohol dehydrogenase-like predicted oxidoreductase